MECHLDHSMTVHGYRLSPDELEAFRFGLHAYTKMVKHGYGPNFDQTDEVSKEFVELIGHVEEVFAKYQGFIGSKRLEMLATNCIGPVFHTYEQGEDSTKDTIARLTDTDPAVTAQHISVLGSILRLDDVSVEFIDNGHIPGQP